MNEDKGTAGVNYNKAMNKFCARITINGRRVHGGFFITLEEAIAVRRDLEAKYLPLIGYSEAA